MGSLAEWIGSLSSTFTGVVAILLAWKSEKRAQRSEQKLEEYQAAELSRLHQREHQERIASASRMVSIWWVCHSTKEGIEWGLIVSNSLKENNTVYDLVIQAEYCINDTWYRYEKTVKILPPGLFFFKSKNDFLPENVQEHELKEYKALLITAKHKVRYWFRDSSQYGWHRDDEGKFSRSELPYEAA